MAIPYYDRKLTLLQPDGTPVEAVVRGDQHHAQLRTPDGFALVRHADTGQICYADRDDGGNLASTGALAGVRDPVALGLRPWVRADAASFRRRALAGRALLTASRRCEQRRAARRTLSLRRGAMPAPPGRGTVGKVRGLCLLIGFPDLPMSVDEQELDRFCNAEGYNGLGNAGSVRDYYLAASGGRLDYANLVTSVYVAKHPRKYYADRKIEWGLRAQSLIREALTDLKSKTPSVAGELTTDDGGYVYALNVLYAGACPNQWCEGLWPHSSSLAKPFDLGDGKKLMDYQVTDAGSDLGIATFCHESGHMVCDFPDLYDYGFESEGVGLYCLMAGGTDAPKNPTRICAYLRYKAGWVDRVVPSGEATALELPSDGSGVLLHRRNATEYFLIENRDRAKREPSLPCGGLAVWHVDETGDNQNEQMTAASHYECALEQADGRCDLEHRRNLGGDGDLFAAPAHTRFSDDTAPAAKWWDGSPSGLHLDDIGEPGDMMRVRVGQAVPPELPNAVVATSKPELPIPDNDPVGVTDSLKVDSGDALVGAIAVRVNIAHPYRADLRLTLVSPRGTEVTLSDREGGGNADLVERFDVATVPELAKLTGEPASGRWSLRVQDLEPEDTGLLREWAIELAPSESKSVVLTSSPGKLIPDGDPKGLVLKLKTDAPGSIGDVAVEVDITHTYVGDLRVTLVAPSGTEVVLHDRAGGGQGKLVRRYTSAEVEGLAGLRGEKLAGVWKLVVVDAVTEDRGKVNRWRVEVG